MARLRAIAAALGLAVLAAAGATNDPGRAADVRSADTERAATGLALENARLQAQVARLTNEVAGLWRRLAEATAALDRERAAADRASLAVTPVMTGAEGVRLDGAAVVDVNRALGLAAVDAGAASGLRPGVRLTVLRKDRVVGTLRLVDVRERIAGGVVEATAAGAYPERNDRVLVAR